MQLLDITDSPIIMGGRFRGSMGISEDLGDAVVELPPLLDSGCVLRTWPSFFFRSVDSTAARLTLFGGSTQ